MRIVGLPKAFLGLSAHLCLRALAQAGQATTSPETDQSI